MNKNQNPPSTAQKMERWKPSVTVAAIIEQDGLFLLLEEHTVDGLRLNNPAGHLDPAESPIQACIRETLEETARVLTPTALVGIYLSRFVRPAQGGRPVEDVTYLRFAFCGTVGGEIAGKGYDDGIVRTLWMTPDEVRTSYARHRSPLVLQCMEDYLCGKRLPLDAIYTHAMVTAG